MKCLCIMLEINDPSKCGTPLSTTKTYRPLEDLVQITGPEDYDDYSIGLHFKSGEVLRACNGEVSVEEHDECLKEEIFEQLASLKSLRNALTESELEMIKKNFMFWTYHSIDDKTFVYLDCPKCGNRPYYEAYPFIPKISTIEDYIKAYPQSCAQIEHAVKYHSYVCPHAVIED